jgi:hypothetical protein
VPCSWGASKAVHAVRINEMQYEVSTVLHEWRDPQVQGRGPCVRSSLEADAGWSLTARDRVDGRGSGGTNSSIICSGASTSSRPTLFWCVSRHRLATKASHSRAHTVLPCAQWRAERPRPRKRRARRGLHRPASPYARRPSTTPTSHAEDLPWRAYGHVAGPHRVNCTLDRALAARTRALK